MHKCFLLNDISNCNCDDISLSRVLDNDFIIFLSNFATATVSIKLFQSIRNIFKLSQSDTVYKFCKRICRLIESC